MQDAAQESVWTKANTLTDFSFPWKTVASLIANGYRVVAKVDLNELDRLKLWQDKDSKTLMCAIMRAEFSADGKGGQKREWISWIKPDSVKPDFHIPSAFGTCTLVK